MIFIPRQETFVCDNCNKTVKPLEHGSYRNHCPFCLYSKHVDKNGPGDRLSDCLGLMKAINIDKKNGEYRIVHRCTVCDKTIPNVVAPDDDMAQYVPELP